MNIEQCPMCMGKTHERFLFRVWFPCKSVGQYVDKSSWAEAEECRGTKYWFLFDVRRGVWSPSQEFVRKTVLIWIFPRKSCCLACRKWASFSGQERAIFFIDCKGGWTCQALLPTPTHKGGQLCSPSLLTFHLKMDRIRPLLLSTKELLNICRH